MKYRYLLVFAVLFSCTTVSTNKYEKPVFNSNGFAYIYSIEDFESKVIKKKINNYEPIIAHSKVRKGALLKITNPKMEKI